MEDDRPWPVPAEYVVVGRKWKYAPPPWAMYEAVVDDMDQWLSLVTGEIRPQVAAARRPDSVPLMPWVDAEVAAVELLIGQDGYGSAITVLAYGTSRSFPPIPGGGSASGSARSSARLFACGSMNRGPRKTLLTHDRVGPGPVSLSVCSTQTLGST
jgi:hypothetical protein